ncbi:hypothetical protein C8J56DRAFT_1045654 [Mycena floridula]|nr:hypothetical protein C8J56DRAFT_1045654 [Mycena floridula]
MSADPSRAVKRELHDESLPDVSEFLSESTLGFPSLPKKYKITDSRPPIPLRKDPYAERNAELAAKREGREYIHGLIPDPVVPSASDEMMEFNLQDFRWAIHKQQGTIHSLYLEIEILQKKLAHSEGENELLLEAMEAIRRKLKAEGK